MQAFVSATPLPALHPHSAKRTRPARTTLSPAACDRPPSDEDAPTVPPNWREFRAALVAGSAAKHEQAKEAAYRPGHWAHPLSLPEPGCFLASHPAYYRRHAPYLTQAVIFLLDYAPDRGATGLVLNRPLAGSADELAATGMFGRSGLSAVASTPFSTQPVYLGGPYGLPTGVLAVLHADKHISGQQPLDGVFVRDFPDYISRRTDLGFDDPHDCNKARVFVGCMRWDAGALEAEVDEGSWYCVAASELYALEHCIQLPKPLWVEIMQAQGQPFARIADQVYGKDDGATE